MTEVVIITNKIGKKEGQELEKCNVILTLKFMHL